MIERSKSESKNLGRNSKKSLYELVEFPETADKTTGNLTNKINLKKKCC